jgi:hypothetical protein
MHNPKKYTPNQYISAQLKYTTPQKESSHCVRCMNQSSKGRRYFESDQFFKKFLQIES